MPKVAESAVVATSIAAVRAGLEPYRRQGTIGLVPTMGALHAGHASLIRRARRDCDAVVVSVFVNPLQFDQQADLERYPRPLDADVELCRRLGVDFVFAPPVSEMYPSKPLCTVEVARIGDHLCGRYRPGHFRGVATVVDKLFQIIQPDAAYFGEKDAQQLAVIRRMVSDLNIPVQIVGVPTVREADGLAVSSRNQHLSSDERVVAITLYMVLLEARRLISAGTTDPAAVRRGAIDVVRADPALRLEYLEIVDPHEMQPVDRIDGPVLVAGALWVGSTRLIDNLTCVPPAIP
jgi:pantoate--beta-alanine ligase